MPVDVNALLQVADPAGVRQLNTADFKTAATLAASEAKLEAVRALLALVLAGLPASPETGLAKDATLTSGVQKSQVTNFPASQPVSGTVIAVGPLTDAQLRATPVAVAGAVTEVTTDDAFNRTMNAQPRVGEEIRFEDLSTDRFHGLANDNVATSAASWSLVRFYKDAGGNITRIRYRSGITWDGRAAGWT